MFNKWASQQQKKKKKKQKKTKKKKKKKKKEPQSFNCTCNGVFISFLSNINRLVFNAIGLCDLHKTFL